MSFQDRFREYLDSFETTQEFYPDVDKIMEILWRYDNPEPNTSIRPLFSDYNIMFSRMIEKYNHGRKYKCIECGCDIGKSNPRQYCGKYQCDRD